MREHMNADDDGWIRTTRRRIGRKDTIKVTWTVGSLQFTAMGAVEEKPHRMDPEDSQIRLKIAPGDRTLVIADRSGECVTDVEAGFLWDGWLFVAEPMEFFRLAD
jgi:hypothetical protein